MYGKYTCDIIFIKCGLPLIESMLQNLFIVTGNKILRFYDFLSLGSFFELRAGQHTLAVTII